MWTFKRNRSRHLPSTCHTEAEGLSQGQDHMVSLDAVKKSLSAPVQSSPLQGYLLSARRT